MSTRFNFINVGQGNMTLIELSNGKKILYDCNVTNDNWVDVITHIDKQIKVGTTIDVFCCSHRDADHMRGVEIVHEYFPIKHVWDSEVTGTTPSNDEHKKYMELRRNVGYTEIKSGDLYACGKTELKIMNGKNDGLPNNPNAQSIVMKVTHNNTAGKKSESVLLTGDSDIKTWLHIISKWEKTELSCSILLASHHGSMSYFQSSNDPVPCTSHLLAKSPAMTIVSVGDNTHGHPDRKALQLYEKYSTGSNKGNKVYRTDKQGHICLELKDEGGWSMTVQNKNRERTLA